MSKKETSCKMCCAPQLQAWYAADKKICRRLRSPRGERFVSGRLQADGFSLNNWLCLFERNLVRLGDLVRPYDRLVVVQLWPYIGMALYRYGPI